MRNDQPIFIWAILLSFILLVLLGVAHYCGLFFPQLTLLFSVMIIFYQILVPLRLLEHLQLNPRTFNIYAHNIDCIIDYLWPPFGPKKERIDFTGLACELKHLFWAGSIILSAYAVIYVGYFKVAATIGSNSLDLRLNLPPRFFYELVMQVFVVALPEEIFYRGFLQGALLKKWPNRRFFLGLPMGRAIILTNLVFALAHFIGPFAPLRLLTFFPGLIFSYFAFKHKSILSAIIFHALCNLLGQILYASVFIN